MSVKGPPGVKQGLRLSDRLLGRPRDPFGLPLHPLDPVRQRPPEPITRPRVTGPPFGITVTATVIGARCSAHKPIVPRRPLGRGRGPLPNVR
ncbi:hypothetical protein GCM10010277_61110 [Streptomyces longisporoflavus]|nr:hypothetical protein GCM10010277_61110 [Streptomyces longisporoflavus]